MQNIVRIDLNEIIEKHTHGFSLTIEEQRWLLISLGIKLPKRMMRCNDCNETGIYQSLPTIIMCKKCNGRGRYEIPETFFFSSIGEYKINNCHTNLYIIFHGQNGTAKGQVNNITFENGSFTFINNEAFFINDDIIKVASIRNDKNEAVKISKLNDGIVVKAGDYGIGNVNLELTQ